MKIKFWWKENEFDYCRRWRIFTIAWGKGRRPLAGSKKYYAKKFTLSLVPTWFRWQRNYGAMRLRVLGFELHYTPGF